MTEFWLVRHGQTDWNLEGRLQGHQDIPLNSTGQQQAQALAPRLEDVSFNAIYSSDLRRARQTAEILAERLGLPVHLDRRLREISHGDWEGLQLSFVQQQYRQQHQRSLDDEMDGRAPGGESMGEVAVRIRQAADEIAKAHPGGRVLLVSHGHALGTLICLARRLPLIQAMELVPKNAEPTILQWEEKSD